MKKYLLLVCALSCIVFAKAKDWTQYVNPLMGSQSSFELSTGNTYPAMPAATSAMVNSAPPWGVPQQFRLSGCSSSSTVAVPSSTAVTFM